MIDRLLGVPGDFVRRRKFRPPAPKRPPPYAALRQLLELGFNGAASVEAKGPALDPAATWQAGVTPGNDRYKILLNGEPMPNAVAANDRIGWVDVQVFSQKINAGFTVSGVERRKGYIQVVGGDQ